MSLIKNLKRREVEIFGAKRIVRNEIKKQTDNREITKKVKTAKNKKVEEK